MAVKTTTDSDLTATTARHYAKRIATECSQCFKSVKARKFLGSWTVDIDGGSGACYGRSIKDTDTAEDVLRIFANDK